MDIGRFQSITRIMELPFQYDFAYYEQNQETLRRLQDQADRLVRDHGVLQVSWGYHYVDDAPNTTNPPDEQSCAFAASTLEQVRSALALTRNQLCTMDEGRMKDVTMPSHVDISDYRNDVYQDVDSTASTKYDITRIGLTTGPFVDGSFSAYDTAEEYVVTIDYPESHRYDANLLAIGGSVVRIAMRRTNQDGIREDLYDGLEHVPEIQRICFLADELSQLEQ